MSAASIRRRSLKAPSLQDLPTVRRGFDKDIMRNPFHMQLCDYQNFSKKFHGKLHPKLQSPRLKTVHDNMRQLGRLSARNFSTEKYTPVLKEARQERPQLVKLSASPYANSPELKGILSRTKSSSQRIIPQLTGSISTRRFSTEDWLQTINSNKSKARIGVLTVSKGKPFEDEDYTLSTSRTELIGDFNSSDDSLQDLVDALRGEPLRSAK